MNRLRTIDSVSLRPPGWRNGCWAELGVRFAWDRRRYIALLLAGANLFALRAEDQKPPPPPNLVLAQPPGLVTGVTNTLKLRGQRLKDATVVRVVGGGATNEATIRQREDVKVPERFTPEKAGDQVLQVEFIPPANVAVGTNLSVMVISPAGESAPLSLFVTGPAGSVEEAKSAAGFRSAPVIPEGQFLRGVVDGRREVEVFRLEGRAGDRIRAELWATRLGSTLDASLTLHDARGAVLAVNDDAAGRDPILTYVLPAAGTYFLSLVGVDERSAPTHFYLLRVTRE